MRLKVTFLLFLFMGLFTLEQCNPCRCPEVQGSYFQIDGMEVRHTIANANEPQSTAMASEYLGIEIVFNVNYISDSQCSSQSTSFFGRAAYACSCVTNGENGAKHQEWKNIHVISLGNMNDTSLASDTVSHLFEAQMPDGTSPIGAFPDSTDRTIQYESFGLSYIGDPNAGSTLHFKVVVELSTGEAFIAETPVLSIE